MRIRDFVIICALLLGWTWASAQTYTFGLADTNGNLYCDYLEITVSGGVAVGIDNMSACGFSTSPVLIGLVSSNPLIAPYKVVTSGLDLADNVADWEAQQYTGDQVFLHTALKCNKQNPSGKYTGKYGWLLFIGNEGFVYGYNYGYLSCSIPGVGDGNVLARGMAIGKLASWPRE